MHIKLALTIASSPTAVHVYQFRAGAMTENGALFARKAGMAFKFIQERGNSVLFLPLNIKRSPSVHECDEMQCIAVIVVAKVFDWRDFVGAQTEAIGACPSLVDIFSLHAQTSSGHHLEKGCLSSTR